MKKESNIEKTAFDLPKEEFYEMEQERLSENSSFEDPSLEKFVKEPSEPDSNDNFELKPFQIFLLIFLFLIMLLVSIVSGSNGGMEYYVAIPIAILSFSGVLFLIKCAKKHDEENNKRYK